MVETEWPAVSGMELEHDDRRWELTGTVEIRNTGDLLAVEAKRTDDVRQPTAMLQFGLGDQSSSLNPGDLQSRFSGFERDEDAQYLVVKSEPKTYRYELQGITYE